jgi:glucan endo-1,3-alpha-glucosidase
MTPGAQKIELLDGNGSVVMTATSAMDVMAETDGICNFNYQVAALL